MSLSFHQYKMKYLVTQYDQFLSRISSQGESINPSPFFIMGPGRTGSTLLSCILNNHEHICIPSESDLISLMIKYWRRKKFSNWDDKVDFVMNLLDRPSGWKFNRLVIKDKLLALDQSKQKSEHVIALIYTELALEQNERYLGREKTINYLFFS